MKWMWENKFSVLAGLGIVLGLYLSKSGIAALMPLARILIPVVAVVFVLGFLKKKFASAIGGGFQKKMQQAMEDMQARQNAAAGGGANKTIDLCNKCGSYKEAGHVCK
jgi:hypothetical protein